MNQQQTDASNADSRSGDAVGYAAPLTSLRDLFPASVLWRIGIIALLIGILFRHELYRLVIVWSTNGTWSHGWLVPVFSLYFLYSRRDWLLRTPVRTNLLGLVVVLAALGMYGVAIWPIRAGYPKDVAMVLLILGVVLWLTGWKMTRVCLFPILYLMLALPLPERLYVSATMPLRVLATKVTTTALNVTISDLMAEPAGTVIEYLYQGERGKLNVVEACSGMRSLMGLCALGVALAFLGRRPIWQRVLLVASCVPIAVFCNVLRVFATSLLQVFGHEALAQGSAHMMLGLLTFLMAAGLFVLESYILSNLFVEDSDDQDTDPEAASAGAHPTSSG